MDWWVLNKRMQLTAASASVKRQQQCFKKSIFPDSSVKKIVQKMNGSEKELLRKKRISVIEKAKSTWAMEA